MAKVRKFILAMGLAVVGWVTICEATTTPSIQRVQHLPAAILPESDAPVRLELSKFVAESGGSDIFRVTWAPGDRGVPAGVVLRLTYRHERIATWQTLEIAYPFDVQDRRTAIFEVGPRALSRGGKVVAWQVELLQNGRLLARKTSDPQGAR